MNEEGRRKYQSGSRCWRCCCALALAPLPFVTEDRYFRVLPGALLFIFPPIMLLATMFPAGCGCAGFVVRIAPPAAYFVSYYSARRWLEDVRNDFVGYAAELNGIKSRAGRINGRCAAASRKSPTKSALTPTLRPSSPPTCFRRVHRQRCCTRRRGRCRTGRTQEGIASTASAHRARNSEPGR